MGQGYQGALSVLLCAASDCVSWHTRSLLSYSLLTGIWAAGGGGTSWNHPPQPCPQASPTGDSEVGSCVPCRYVAGICSPSWGPSHLSSGEEDVFRMLAEGKRELLPDSLWGG